MQNQNPPTTPPPVQKRVCPGAPERKKNKVYCDNVNKIKLDFSGACDNSNVIGTYNNPNVIGTYNNSNVTYQAVEDFFKDMINKSFLPKL
jgi:hypothetical protein